MAYKHILVALELSEECNVLIDRAKMLGKALGADVSFIHVNNTVGEVYPELYDIVAEPDRRLLNDRENKQLFAFKYYADFKIKHFLVGTGDLSDKLSDTIKEHGFDLLVCGHHRDFWHAFVSYAKSLIGHSPIDVLVVPIKSE